METDILDKGDSIEKKNIEFKKAKSFPLAMFEFRNYDGGKAFAAILFLLTCLYFVSGMWTLFSWEDKWWRPDFAFKFGYFLYHLFVFTIIYCVLWLAFDKRGIEGFVLSLFSTLLGIIYIISPIDFIPDPIPVIGAWDDVIVGVSSIILGLKSWHNNKLKADRAADIVQLLENNRHDEALHRFLRSMGYTVPPKIEE